MDLRRTCCSMSKRRPFFSQREQHYSSLMQEQSVHSVAGSLNRVDSMQGALDMSPTTDDSMDYLTFPLFGRLQFLVLNDRPYSNGETFLELENPAAKVRRYYVCLNARLAPL